MKIKYKDIPKIKKKLIKEQEGMCAICDRPFENMPSKEICLDHNHKTGFIRGVLCRGCNSMEGKVYRLFVRMGLKNRKVNYATLLIGLAAYFYYPDTVYVHPKFKVKK